MFSTYGQGSIWSSSAEFSVSRITTILDKAGFTLEDLLQEDDLLQEIKANNERLISFLGGSQMVQKLLDFVIMESSSEETDVIKFKYPFMACEVICCEVVSILDTLVSWNDQALLQKLFSILNTDGNVNHYSAGYFEKILEILFRKRTSQVMTFINSFGESLLNNFLKHIDNYSIMQIVQRLMLPHIPFVVDMMEDGTTPMEAASTPPSCSWSYLPNVCSTLIGKMTDQSVSSSSFTVFHISELLITVVQLSPPDTLFVSHMCAKENLERLFKGAFQQANSAVEDGEKMIYPTLNTSLNASSELAATSSDDDDGKTSSDDDHHRHQHDFEDRKKSLSLACIAVLESLISRMSEALTPYDPSSGVPEPQIDHAQVSFSVSNICDCVLLFLPKLTCMLKSVLTGCLQAQIQTKRLCNRLGHCGLQLIKLVEAVVRLNRIALDEGLISEGIIRICLQIFFGFELNSLLHLAIHRIVLLSIEGQAERRVLQRHIVIGCELLQQILATMNDKERMNEMLANGRRPLIGHLIVMSQAVVGLCNMEADADTQSGLTDSGFVGLDGGDKEVGGENFRSIVNSSAVIAEWNAYVSGELAEINSLQTTALGTIDSAEDAQMMMLMMGAGMTGGNAFTSAPFGTNTSSSSGGRSNETDASGNGSGSADLSQGGFGSAYRSYGINSGSGQETGGDANSFADFSSAFHQEGANAFKSDSDSDDSSSGEENVDNSDSDDDEDVIAAAGGEEDGRHKKHHHRQQQQHQDFAMDNGGLSYMLGSGSGTDADNYSSSVNVVQANKAGKKHHRHAAADVSSGYNAPDLVSFQMPETVSNEFSNFDPFGTGASQVQNVPVEFGLPQVEDLSLNETQDADSGDSNSQVVVVAVASGGVSNSEAEATQVESSENVA